LCALLLACWGRVCLRRHLLLLGGLLSDRLLLLGLLQLLLLADCRCCSHSSGLDCLLWRLVATADHTCRSCVSH
jgi:hypothetical protein